MIKARLYVTGGGKVCGFKVSGHDRSIVCAAVSMLCINTVNSLERLTEAELEYCYSKDGGYIECVLPGFAEGKEDQRAAVLIYSLAMGLEDVSENYGVPVKFVKKKDFAVSRVKNYKYFKR